MSDSMQPGGEQHAARPMTLGLLWQHKWLALVVFLVFSIPVVAAIWILYVPTYSANAIIEVSPIIRGILDDNDQVPYYKQFLNTQAAAIRSPTVLQRVLEDPEVRETGWYKNPPRFSALRGSGQELERLQADLSVRPRANTSYVDVKMSTRNPKEAALIVNAVVDNYFVDVQDRAQQSNNVVYGVVVREYNEVRARIDGLNSSIAKMRGEIGHWTPDQLLAQQRARLDELKDAQDRYQALRERKVNMELDRRAPASIQLLSKAYPSSRSGNARRRMMLTAMGLFGAVMLGLAAAYLRAVTTSSVQHAEDLGS